LPFSFVTDLPDRELFALATAASAEARRRRSPTSAAPLREQALDALELLGVPASATLTALVVQARTGAVIDARALTTVRRDDQRTWERESAAGNAHDPKVAPALHHATLAPVRGQLVVSSWELSCRLITPHSPRADLPLAALAVLAEAERLGTLDAEAVEALLSLAIRLVSGLPGGRVHSRDDVADRLTAIAQQELDRHGGDAGKERAEAAAAALVGGAAEDELVWGRPGPGRPRRRLADDE
jgi:hypothetical protein